MGDAKAHENGARCHPAGTCKGFRPVRAPTGTGQNSRFSATMLTKIVSATGDTFITDGG
jgi:hypothetical protein